MNTSYTCFCLNLTLRVIRTFNNYREDELSLIAALKGNAASFVSSVASVGLITSNALNSMGMSGAVGTGGGQWLPAEMDKVNFEFQELVDTREVEFMKKQTNLQTKSGDSSFTMMSCANVIGCRNCGQDCFVAIQNSSKILLNGKMKTAAETSKLKNSADYSTTFKIVLRANPIDGEVKMNSLIYNRLLRQTRDALDKAKLEMEQKIAEFTRQQQSELLQVESRLRVELSTLISKHAMGAVKKVDVRRLFPKTPNLSPQASYIDHTLLIDDKDISLVPGDILQDVTIHSDVITTSFADAEKVLADSKVQPALIKQQVVGVSATPNQPPFASARFKSGGVSMVSFQAHPPDQVANSTIRIVGFDDMLCANTAASQNFAIRNSLDTNREYSSLIPETSILPFSSTPLPAASDETSISRPMPAETSASVFVDLKKTASDELFDLEEDLENEDVTPFIASDIEDVRTSSPDSFKGSIEAEHDTKQYITARSQISSALPVSKTDKRVIPHPFPKIAVGSLPMEILRPIGLASSLFHHRPAHRTDASNSPPPKPEHIPSTLPVALERQHWPHTLTEPSFWSLATDIDLRSANYRAIAND